MESRGCLSHLRFAAQRSKGRNWGCHWNGTCETIQGQALGSWGVYGVWVPLPACPVRALRPGGWPSASSPPLGPRCGLLGIWGERCFPFCHKILAFTGCLLSPNSISHIPKGSIRWWGLSLGSCPRAPSQPPSPALQCVQPSGRGYPEVWGETGAGLPQETPWHDEMVLDSEVAGRHGWLLSLVGC